MLAAQVWMASMAFVGFVYSMRAMLSTGPFVGGTVHSPVPDELRRYIATKTFTDSILRLACAFTLKDPFVHANRTIWALTLLNTLVSFLYYASELLIFQNLNSEGDWSALVSYAVALIVLTIGRDWHIYDKKMFKPPKPDTLNAPIVSRIIADVYKLPPALREAYISQGFRMLIRKAIVMIKYVDSKLNKRPAPEELGEEVRAKVQETLALTKGDFAVLLGIAEKLKPNFYIDLVGDPNIIQEQFIELFDTF